MSVVQKTSLTHRCIFCVAIAAIPRLLIPDALTYWLRVLGAREHADLIVFNRRSLENGYFSHLKMYQLNNTYTTHTRARNICSFSRWNLFRLSHGRARQYFGQHLRNGWRKYNTRIPHPGQTPSRRDIIIQNEYTPPQNMTRCWFRK